MNDNMKDFENTNLTDEQTEEVAGGYPVVSRPFPRNAELDDKQAEQVSGGRRRPRSSKIELTDDQQTSRATAWPPINPPHRNHD